MTDPWETRVEPAPPKSGISPGMIAAIATSVLVLSVAGATGGWLLAGSPEASPSSSPTPKPSLSAEASPSPSASASPSPSPVTSPSPAQSGSSRDFALPEPGTQPFQTYFAQLRELNLGVLVIFGESGETGQVVRTLPVVGSTVRRGNTIKLYVAGDAPQTELKYVINRPCTDAKNWLTPYGLVPTYVGIRVGVVIEQNPDPTQGGTAKWNDKIELKCGPVGQATGSPSP